MPAAGSRDDFGIVNRQDAKVAKKEEYRGEGMEMFLI
jgi:hypothetical protein